MPATPTTVPPEHTALIGALVQARRAQGLTQAQLAQKMGTTQSVVARLESGRARPAPALATLMRYARALGCRLEWTLVAQEPPPAPPAPPEPQPAPPPPAPPRWAL